MKTLIELLDEDDANCVDWDAVTKRAKSHPWEAQYEYRNECTCSYTVYRAYHPLHKVVEMDPPLHAVSAILEAYPLVNAKISSLKVHGFILPLGLACNCQANEEIVRLLLTSYLDNINRLEILRRTVPWYQPNQKSHCQAYKSS